MRPSDNQIDLAAGITAIILPLNWGKNSKLIQIANDTNKGEIHPFVA
jgi:hypothetical protein